MFPMGATSEASPANLTLSYHHSNGEITLEVTRHGGQSFQLEFLPSFSLRTQVLSAEIDGKPAKFEAVEPANEVDQHIAMRMPIRRDHTVIRIRLRDDFGIVYPYTAPATGAVSSNLKFISEQWNAAHDRLELQVAGAGGAKYRVPLAGDLTGVNGKRRGDLARTRSRSSSRPAHRTHIPRKW